MKEVEEERDGRKVSEEEGWKRRGKGKLRKGRQRGKHPFINLSFFKDAFKCFLLIYF